MIDDVRVHRKNQAYKLTGLKSRRGGYKVEDLDGKVMSGPWDSFANALASYKDLSNQPVT